MIRLAPFTFALCLMLVRAHAETPFFNGHNLEGWTKPNGKPVGDGWEVVDGAIHRRGDVKRAGHIVTGSTFGDFDLRFDWKVAPGGNSGVKYRVKKYDGKIRGLEYQLLDDAAHGQLPQNKRSAALYDLYTPNRHKSLKPANEFNRSRIVVQNDTVLHYLNGALVLSANIRSQEWKEKVAGSKFAELVDFGENQFGQIMLTDHGCEVWYKNIEFIPLPTNEFPEPTAPVEGAIAEFELPDYMGKNHALSDYGNAPIIVLAFLGTECPLAKLYANRLVELNDKYGEQVQFLGVNSNVQDSLKEIAAFTRKHQIPFPILKDLGNQLADDLGVKRAPQVVVLDKDRRVRYQGRIDDQYVVGVVRDRATAEELRDSLQELLSGSEVTVPETEAVGCLIGRAPAATEGSSQDVTFSNQIARIFQRRCVTCHRSGDIGPFELTSYDEVAGWGDMIKEVIEDQRMPPWHADPNHGEFANDASMTSEEKELVYAWVDAGCPEGDPNQLPEPLVFTDGWQLPREPERVIAMSDSPFEVPANAGRKGVPYQYFEVDPEFDEDQWIEAAEVQPGNKSVVHHIIVYAQPPNEKGRRSWIFLTAYVPGLRYEPLPENSAKKIPAGSSFIFEMHYTPVGSVQDDISQLGLLFADPETITHEVVTTEVACYDFQIPPRDANYRVSATSRQVRYDDVTIRSLAPHMHLRGKSFRYELVTPNGDRQTLLDVPAYDFNWQTTYVLKQPLAIPKGALIHCKASFDNSEQNLANPDPNRQVTWGDQSWDEMMIGFCDVIVPIREKRRPGHKLIGTGVNVVGVFDDTDQDGDFQLSRDEAEKHDVVKKLFDVLDFDKNDRLELREALKAIEMMRN